MSEEQRPDQKAKPATDRRPSPQKDVDGDTFTEPMIDETIEESFPASDPPSWSPTHADAPKASPREQEERGRKEKDAGR